MGVGISKPQPTCSLTWPDPIRHARLAYVCPGPCLSLTQSMATREPGVKTSSICCSPTQIRAEALLSPKELRTLTVFPSPIDKSHCQLKSALRAVDAP